MKIYVGNLPYAVTEDDLKDSFSEFGEVLNINIVADNFTGQSKGYGFVEMQDDADASNAIQALDESPLKGRNIIVNRARPRNARIRRRQRH
jgi:RNA recognition motif-containing protein